jgi:hypothetical protein
MRGFQHSGMMRQRAPTAAKLFALVLPLLVAGQTPVTPEVSTVTSQTLPSTSWGVTNSATLLAANTLAGTQTVQYSQTFTPAAGRTVKVSAVISMTHTGGWLCWTQ